MAKKINPMLAIVGGLFGVLLLFSIIAVVLYPGPSVMEATDGDTVSVHYVGKYQNGTVFDSNTGEDGREPLKFVLGNHEVIPGFENAVHGMKVHQSKTVTIAPEDAYQYYPELVMTYDRADVVESLGAVPAVGEKLMMMTTTGSVVEGTVTEVTETSITIDFNREIAGKTLVFDITVVNIVKGEIGSH
ncbi:FKBP-type peptidyl-prolyl cis-trans isomerase [Methanimicrococcus hacksteinii]|nr:FKBP-type peptidyl-prolyl cis-trans isomerase [Methanimicrococcus sp. At1]